METNLRSAMCSLKGLLTALILTFSGCFAYSQAFNENTGSVRWSLGPGDPRIEIQFRTTCINTAGYEHAAPVITNNFPDELYVNIQFTLWDFCGGSATFSTQEKLGPRERFAPDVFMAGFEFQTPCKKFAEFGSNNKYKTRIQDVGFTIVTLRNLTEEKKEAERAKKAQAYNAKINEADGTFGGAETEEDFTNARALYQQALVISPDDYHPQQRIELIEEKIQKLRDKAEEKAAEELRKAEEEEERKTLEAERKLKEEEDRLAEQKTINDKTKMDELEAAATKQRQAEELQREQEEKEAMIRKAEEKEAEDEAEAHRIQKEKEKEDAEKEREYEEQRKKDKEADEETREMAAVFAKSTKEWLKREWENARADWDANPPTAAEKTKRYDRATAIMADAELAGWGANENTIVEAIRLYPNHPDIRSWIGQGSVKAGLLFSLADRQIRYKGVREHYQQSLSYEEQQKMARGQILYMSRKFSEMSSLDHNFKDPEALIESVNRRMSLISQQKAEATQFHLDNFDAKLKKNATLNSITATQADRTAALVGEAIGSVGDIFISKSEAKRARESLESQKRYQMESIRDGIVDDTSNGIEDLKSSFFNTDNQDAENAALNSYYNLICYQQQVKTRFNYDETDWYDNYCAETQGDQYYKNLKQINSTSDLLNVASRKAQLYASTKIESFKDGALFRLGEVVKTNHDNAENMFFSYHIYQQLSTDAIEKIQYQFAKRAVVPEREEAQYLAAENKLKEIIKRCIQTEDVETFTIILNKKLHRQIGPHFGEVSIPAIINGDKSAILSLLLKNDEEFNTQQLKNGLLIESLAADASANTAVLVANGADVNQKLDNNNQKQVPLLLLFSEKKPETITHLMRKNTDFDAINALLKDEPNMEIFYNKMLQVAVTHDNIFAMKVVAANARSYLVKVGNQTHNLFKEAVRTSSYRVLDSLFGYSTNDLDKNYLVFNSSNRNVINVLKRRGLDLNYKNSEGLTALHKAVGNEDHSAVTSLVEAGADGGVLNSKGFSPIHLAVYEKNSRALQAMVRANKRTAGTQDKTYGWTPLHFAARENYVEGCQILLQNGADKNAEDRWGRTPYKIAKERHFVSLKSLLK